MSEKRVYSPDFFHCQVVFAVKLHTVLWEAGIDIPFEEVLKNNTTLHRELTHKGKNQKGKEGWKKAIETIPFEPDSFTELLANQLYTVYVEQSVDTDLMQTDDSCLKTELVPAANGIQMHYVPSIRNGKSTLSAVNRAYRFEEYFERFQQLFKQYPEDTKLFGFSWLYNLEIYTWLFPPFAGQFDREGKVLKLVEGQEMSIGTRMYPAYDSRYVEGTTSMPLNSWAIWGQFLQKGYETNTEKTVQFERAVSAASYIEEVIDSFPYPLRYYENTLLAWWNHLQKMAT